MTTINPYLTFNGNCEEAFNFYKSIFGGEFTYIGRFGEMPANEEIPIVDSFKDKIMHVSLPISKETTLMGSDSSEAFGKATIVGNNITMSVHSDTIPEITRLFNELANGGNISMPLNKTFWGSHFGMLTDKFGIHWMLSCELKEHKDFENENK